MGANYQGESFLVTHAEPPHFPFLFLGIGSAAYKSGIGAPAAAEQPARRDRAGLLLELAGYLGRAFRAETCAGLP